MHTKQALRELGVTGKEMTEEQRRSLDEKGFFIQESIYTPEQCRVMAEEFDRLHAREGDKGGHEVHFETAKRCSAGRVIAARSRT